MNPKERVLLALCLGSLVGCVSSKQYRTKERENAQLQKQLDALAQQKAALDEATKAKEAEIARLKGTYDQLVDSLKGEISKGEIQVTQLKGKLSVNLVEKILFNSGQAQIKESGMEVLDRIGEILKKIQDKDIRIEGHTDNVPLGRKLRERYPTNWELSTARATNMVRYLQEKVGVDPHHLIAVGYGEYRPVASNDTEEGRTQNRRIEIALVASEKPATPHKTAASSQAVPSSPPPAIRKP